MQDHNPDLPIRVISDAPFPRIGRGAPLHYIHHEDTDIGARYVKLNLDKISPFDYTLYIDADTRVHGDISAPFGLLDAGWELCMCPCTRQGDGAHTHVNEEERQATFAEVGTHAQALQAGVMYFRKSSAMRKLFSAWRAEWKRWEDQDQAALVRALARVPVKLRTLHSDYNDPRGRLIAHYCGFARRDGLPNSRPV
jgi:lipopolysaccharide biosynthesis glycosyltransferase